MRSPNRSMAAVAALLLLVAGLVPATAGSPCGPEPDCGPCGRQPTDARIGPASCCCCGDLAAAESAAPEVAEGAVDGGVSFQTAHATTSQALPKSAATATGSASRAGAPRAPAGRAPLFQLYQSLLI